MDSEEDNYEFDVDFAVPSVKNRVPSYESQRATTSSSSPSSSSDHEDQDNILPSPNLPLFQTMDIPSVRGPPVSVMMPADRVSTHDLPLAESLSTAVKKEKYHTTIAIRSRTGRLEIELLEIDGQGCRHYAWEVTKLV